MNRVLLVGWLLLNAGFARASQPAIDVRFHEVYELANVILALTDYGIADPNEVAKNTTYYTNVMQYFGPHRSHPVFASVNYSREQWDRFLSFRTDAVAFRFDADNRLVRVAKFYAMGKSINEFEKNIWLVEDFARVSNFRTFFSNHASSYDSLAALYKASLMFNEIQTFLQREFQTTAKAKYAVVLSPLVGRMHCQRTVNGVSTSFIDVPDYLYRATSVNELDRRELALGLHTFFTEIGHDYVNATTKKYKRLCLQKFDPNKWDNGSGYAQHKFATFNEYMTWAVYDVFVQEHFPDIADVITAEWHSVNESRGFFASTVFTEKLTDLRKNSSDKTIASLYPALLDWCNVVQDSLDKTRLKRVR